MFRINQLIIWENLRTRALNLKNVTSAVYAYVYLNVRHALIH